MNAAILRRKAKGSARRDDPGWRCAYPGVWARDHFLVDDQLPARRGRASPRISLTHKRREPVLADQKSRSQMKWLRRFLRSIAAQRRAKGEACSLTSEYKAIKSDLERFSKLPITSHPTRRCGGGAHGRNSFQASAARRVASRSTTVGPPSLKLGKGRRDQTAAVSAISLRRSAICAFNRARMLLCIWLTRLSERSSVAPISFIVISSK